MWAWPHRGIPRLVQVLQLAGNQMQDLKATLSVLSTLPFLTSLNLQSNPLTEVKHCCQSLGFAR